MSTTFTSPRTYGADWRVVTEWLPDEKLHLSRKNGYDVGVPATIDHIILAHEQALRTLPERRNLFQVHLTEWIDVPKRDELISLFFQLGTRKDPDASDSARGELIRFGERHYRVPFYQVRLTRQLVDDYATVNQLSDKTKEVICNRIGVV